MSLIQSLEEDNYLLTNTIRNVFVTQLVSRRSVICFLLMMSDAVEAASKSLKDPTIDKIQNFIESIVNKQVEEKQFNDCNITLAEIETVKKVLSKKLINVYHLRVVYPE